MKNIRAYIENRLDELERFVPDNASLEIDYDDEKDVWYALYYREEDECAYSITVGNKDVVAFEGSSYLNGIDHDELVDVLSDLDVYYVP